MWSWDQGRLAHYQFDALRAVSRYAMGHDLRTTSRADLIAATGEDYLPNDPAYRPFRNYGRIFKTAMLVSLEDGVAVPTPVAAALAADGAVTSDEYFHFLARVTTDPNPALEEWDHTAEIRYPLLFALKMTLANASVGEPDTNLMHIVSAYADSGFIGDEDDTAFIDMIRDNPERHVADQRQAIESIRVLGQISYLTVSRTAVSVNLSEEDAAALFADLAPIGGAPLQNREEEIRRRAALFNAAIGEIDFAFETTRVEEAAEAGFIQEPFFREGRKIRRTHLAIERNAKLRRSFFQARPTTECDMCQMDTAASYPWVPHVLDIHHLLPLSSGTRSGREGTVMDDLVALCPTCHRAVHRYYDIWLRDAGRRDFVDAHEARDVYARAKAERVAP